VAQQGRHGQLVELHGLEQIEKPEDKKIPVVRLPLEYVLEDVANVSG
jgi:hypothetical protein